MSQTVADIFTSLPDIDTELLATFEAKPEPRMSYIIAMTPRSGSSYLCDVMSKMRLFGHPSERLNANFIPNILKRVPATNPDMYLRNTFRQARTPNGIAGLKVSWFQFNNFAKAMAEPESLKKYRFIYLYRRDSILQAISLYRATATDVFHTNVKHSDAALQKLQELDYDYEKIDYWHNHILQQERGWKKYFEANAINPLALTYEDVVDDLPCTLRRIARQVGANPAKAVPPAEASVFTKLSDARSVDWSCRYQRERLEREEAAV